MTEWLTDEELRAWIAYIDLSTLLGDHLDRQLKRDARMPHVCYNLLVRLSAAPGRSLRMTELAEQLKITRGRLSHTLASLEDQGWVTRRADPGDKRGQVAALTDAGATAIAAAAPGHVAAVRRAVFDRLTPEQVRQLTVIAETITAGLTGDAKGPAELPWRRR
ncbi:MAG TPA: MarR family transcriptional regulator [Streptosporangiaceae bacterium]